MEDGWQPSQDVYDILVMSHIDLEFARSLLPEFDVRLFFSLQQRGR